MTKEKFYNIIDEGTINGQIVGNFNGKIKDTDFSIFECGTEPNKPRYYVFSSGDYDLLLNGTDIEAYYDDFYQALNEFRIRGIPIANQIENISQCGFTDYID